ncbi:MAG: hypothetical protein J5585_02770 [Clostridia bacterium]|nr:hypothetical protein [Clostridia bacterium]
MDVTKAEGDEISKMMSYKRPPDLPHEPTEEELETLFPKKSGYFRLSSGRYCIAQSSYVGRVYSDLDTRNGNYIIHAFVMDSLDGLIPMTLIESNLFKTSLTYEEWHENDAPDDLPKVDVSEYVNGLQKRDVDVFFNDERYGYLELLLQAIINSCDSSDKVTFNDTIANLKYWYKAISLCLPNCIQEKLTYCSFYTPLSMVPVTGGPSSSNQLDVRIRNISPALSPFDFSYSQEVQSGKNAFDFERRIINDGIEISEYVKTVVGLVKKNLFTALGTVDAIDRLMTNCGCTIDKATDLYNLQSGNFGAFCGVSELVAVIDSAKKMLPEMLPDAADGIYGYCVVFDHWALCPEILPVYRLVYDYSKRADKKFIIEKYIRNHAAFGVQDGSDCNTFASRMEDSAPFPWVDFTGFLFGSPGFERYFKTIGKSFNSCYLVYKSLVRAIGGLDGDRKKIAAEYFLDTMAKAFEAESNEQFDTLILCIGKLGEKWETWIVKNTIIKLARNSERLTDICRPAFLLNLLKRLNNRELALVLLKQTVLENKEDECFVAEYVSMSDSARETFERYEEALKTDPEFAVFEENVAMYRFKICPKLNRSDLERYFHAVYAKGRDKGLFKEKLSEYLSSVPQDKLIDECREICDTWFANLHDDHPDLIDCLSDICQRIFRLNFDYLITYADKKGMYAFKIFVKRLGANGITIPDRFFVIQLGMETRRLSVKNCIEHHGAIQRLENKEYYRYLPSNELDLFVSCFASDVLKMYLAVSGLGKKFDAVFEACFDVLVDSRKFQESFIAALDELSRKEYEQMMTDIFSYAFNLPTHTAEQMRRFVAAYHEEMKSGKRKKMFAAVLDNVPDEYKANVSRYITTYQKEHETLFDKLFGAIGKKDEDKDDK